MLGKVLFDLYKLKPKSAPMVLKKELLTTSLLLDKIYNLLIGTIKKYAASYSLLLTLLPIRQFYIYMEMVDLNMKS